MSFCASRPAALFAALATTINLAPAVAQEAITPRAYAPGVVSITVENDIFGGTDRNYSNGLRFERISSEENTFEFLKTAARILPGISVDNQVRQGLALSHAIYTPENIEIDPPDPLDRPYAGWLNVSATAVAADKDTQDTVQLNLSLIGPSAGGKFVQVNYHDLIEAKDPIGWDSQLADEVGIELIGQRTQLFKGPDLPFDIRTDIGVHGGLALGNIRTYVNGGATTRLGFGKKSLDADFGPPRIRPALSGAGVFAPGDRLSGYLFAGVDVRAVGRDIFLDGNTFRESRAVDDRYPVVADLQTGVAVQFNGAQLAFTYVYRTEQFEAQVGPQRFGAVSLSVARW